MTAEKVYTAIGLMSGTSLDGVDATLIRTDGADHVEPLGFVSVPYEESLREKIRACLGLADRDDAQVKEAERFMTKAHIEATKKVLSYVKLYKEGEGVNPNIIGLHGQTILHNPNPGGGGITVQIGDAELLARETGIDVVNDFRGSDVAAGGQGAPLLPLYHRARAADLDKPVAIVNIGGVANVTWLGEDEDDILAFDTGPGNALIDDFMRERTGQAFDADGTLAKSGASHDLILQNVISSDYFDLPPPKSLDRDEWSAAMVADLSDADGAATLTAFTVRSIVKAQDHFPAPVKAWYITGGGRHNDFVMEQLQKVLDAPVKPVEDIGWNGDALEAEGFAYLAVRSLLGLPLSLPSTTGVKEPLTGGVLTKCA